MLHRDCETLRKWTPVPTWFVRAYTWRTGQPLLGDEVLDRLPWFFFSRTSTVASTAPVVPAPSPYRRPSVCVAEALLPRVRLPLLVQSGRSARPHVRPRLGSPSRAPFAVQPSLFGVWSASEEGKSCRSAPTCWAGQQNLRWLRPGGTWVLRRKPRRQALAQRQASRGCHGTHRPCRLRLNPYLVRAIINDSRHWQSIAPYR